MLSKLLSALEDESKDGRANVARALGKMGKRAAANKVLSKLVSTLGDTSTCVRRSAVEALGNFGENAATNEVISKLVVLIKNNTVYRSVISNRVQRILNSSTVIRHLDPKVVIELCLSEDGFECLENISAEHLLRFFRR